MNIPCLCALLLWLSLLLTNGVGSNKHAYGKHHRHHFDAQRLIMEEIMEMEAARARSAYAASDSGSASSSSEIVTPSPTASPTPSPTPDPTSGVPLQGCATKTPREFPNTQFMHCTSNTAVGDQCMSDVLCSQ